MLATLVGITLLTWVILELAPGDPATASSGEDQAGEDSRRAAAVVRAKRELLGFLEPRPALEGPEGRVELSAFPTRLADGYLGDVDGGVTRLDGTPVGQLPAGISALAVQGDRVAAGSSDGTLVRWDEHGEARQEGGAVRALSWVDPGLLVVRDSDPVALLDEDLHEVQAWERIPGVVFALEADASGFFTGGTDGRLRRWSLDQTQPLWTLDLRAKAIRDLSLGPGGLAVACSDGSVRLVSVQGEETARYEGHSAPVTAVTWEGSVLRSGSEDGTVRTWADEVSVEEVGEVHDLLGPWVAAETWAEVRPWRRYTRWLGRLVRLDLGRSWSEDQRPVTALLAEALPRTLALNGLALLLIYLVAIPAGVVAALKPRGVFDSLSSVALFALYSVPHFWAASLLLLFLASERYWPLLPYQGLTSTRPMDLSSLQLLGDLGLHLVLPVLVLSLGGIAQLSRYMRTSMLEVVRADFVRTARAKGLPERQVVFRHALRNALITPITLLGQVLPALVGGSVVVETIFGIHGMGELGLRAALSQDYPVVMAITLLSAVLTMAGVLLSDLLYRVADPRVELGL